MSDLFFCLRCKTTALQEQEAPAGKIRYFECPACQRRYTLSPGKGLASRWLEPIALVLYGAQFDQRPQDRAVELAEMLMRQRAPEQLLSYAEEIRLELKDPTQRVRDILDCIAGEEDLREFLRLVAEHIEAKCANSS